MANVVLNGRNGGDTAVCVESAYWLTDNYPGVPGGVEVALPQLDGYTHSQMNRHPCPVLLMLAALYWNDSVGNPWIHGDGSGCENFTTSADNRPAAPANHPVPKTMVDQTVVSGDAAPGSPFVTTVKPEGGDSADATIYLSDGVTPTITVTDLAGKVDPNAVVQVDPNPEPRCRQRHRLPDRAVGRRPTDPRRARPARQRRGDHPGRLGHLVHRLRQPGVR
jgi:hypothetical protein